MKYHKNGIFCLNLTIIVTFFMIAFIYISTIASCNNFCGIILLLDLIPHLISSGILYYYYYKVCQSELLNISFSIIIFWRHIAIMDNGSD